MTIKRMVFFVSCIVLRVMPSVPQLTRWLKTMLAIDWWLLGVCLGNILDHLLCVGMGGIGAAPFVPSSEFCIEDVPLGPLGDVVALADEKADEKLEEDHHVVRTRRFTRVVTTLQTPDTRLCVLAFAIVLAPVRLLQKFFSRCAFNRNVKHRVRPSTTWTSPKESPLIVAQQFLANLLCGGDPTGFHDLMQSHCRATWQRAARKRRPWRECVWGAFKKKFRRIVVALAMPMERRHRARTFSTTSVLCKSVNAKEDVLTRRRCARALAERRRRCMDAGLRNFHEELGATRADRHAVLDAVADGHVWPADWEACLEESVGMMEFVTDDVEYEHAWDHKAAKASGSPGQPPNVCNFTSMAFCSRSLNLSQSKLRMPPSVQMRQDGGQGNSKRRKTTVAANQKGGQGSLCKPGIQVFNASVAKERGINLTQA